MVRIMDIKCFRCNICGGYLNKIFNAKVLHKYNVSYYACKRCGFVQTEEPYWINEAYESAINVYDTGILNRNEIIARKLTLILYYMFDRKGVFLDYAGGYGLLVRKMRDIGFDFYWMDKYSSNLFAKGFAYNYNIKKKVELVSAIEVFEHLVEPLHDIEEMLSFSRNIFFTTTLIPEPIPAPSEWWYYGFEHGQHVSFYSKRTLQYIANKYNLFLISFGDYHLMTEKKMSSMKFYFLLFFADIGLFHYLKLRLHGKIKDDMKLLQKRKFH